MTMSTEPQAPPSAFRAPVLAAITERATSATRRASRAVLRPFARALALVVPLALAPVALAGCSHNYIPNTDVDDNAENRRVVVFCEAYRKAVEQRNVGALLKMAAPTYYEDGGNVDASDDLDYTGLRDYLQNRFPDASAIRYEIRYRRIVREEKMIFVDYTFSASYKIPGGKGNEWRRHVDENRLELIPVGDEYKIVAGM